MVHQNIGLPSDFSKIMTQELEDALSVYGKYKVERNNTRGVFKNKDMHLLNGSYTEENGLLKININLTNTVSNRLVAKGQFFLPLSYFENKNISYKPEKAEEIKDQQSKIKEEAPKNDFEIDIWTNKGNQNLIFTEGEILQLYVNSAMKCYVRFVYVFADGTQVLLLDNVEITDAYVGKDYKIPGEFECAEPFGVETMIFSASTSKFDPIKTYSYEDYKIIEDDLDKTLITTRAFKPKTKVAEKIIPVTTLPKN